VFALREPSCFQHFKLWSIDKDALCRSGSIVGSWEVDLWFAVFKCNHERARVAFGRALFHV
jgi:hypothetical protein